MRKAVTGHPQSTWSRQRQIAASLHNLNPTTDMKTTLPAPRLIHTFWLRIPFCLMLFATICSRPANAQTTKRGMMISGTPDAQSIIALRQLGANLARWQFTIPDAAAADSMTLGQYQ